MPFSLSCLSIIMLKLFVGLSFLGLVASLPTLKSMEDTRIVGGEDIDITDAPYQISIVYRGRHSCGGTIISSDLIITAAHCVMNSSPNDYQIRVGSSSSLFGGDLYPVGEIVWHPDFNYAKMDSDIAVMWLSKPLEFKESVAPIDLADGDEEIDDGDDTIVTGWGHIREGGGLPTTLQKVIVPKVNEKECDIAYSPMYSITPRMLCAGIPAGGKDACQGDSGGPLVYNGKLAGVVSWGIGCARPEYPGVYAKVSALRTWLDDNISNLRLKHLLRALQ